MDAKVLLDVMKTLVKVHLSASTFENEEPLRIQSCGTTIKCFLPNAIWLFCSVFLVLLLVFCSKKKIWPCGRNEHYLPVSLISGLFTVIAHFLQERAHLLFIFTLLLHILSELVL